MASRKGAWVVAGLASMIMMACADPVSSPRTMVSAPSLGVIPPNPTPFTTQRLAENELVELCKDYSGTVGPAVTFDVVVSGATSQSFQVTLSNGQCREIWLNSGPSDFLSITEQVPAGYVASYVLSSKVGTITTQFAPVTSNSISGVEATDGRGSLVVFTNAFTPPPNNGCTLTQGYWKTHPEDWDQVGDPNTASFITTTAFFNSGLSYLDVMLTNPSGGNAYFQLAHQYIAARLSIGGGASSTTAVNNALSGAAAAFAAWPAGTTAPAKNSATRTQWLAWASTLDDYNNGLIGPGHCNN